MSLAHKDVNLKEPYNQDIKDQVATKNFLKKKTDFPWNPNPRRIVCRRYFSKNICSPMQSFFAEKTPQYFVGGEETLCFIFISFPICKNFIPNFCGTNYDLSSKTT